jgi:5-formyltetrahydrofolate cyclo-ligase
MELYQNAKSIGLFLSMPTGEIKTSYAVRHAIQCQKDIYIPQVGENFQLPDMELIKIQTQTTPNDDATTTVTTTSTDAQPIYHSWPKNKWNIPEPPVDVILNTAKPGDIDLLIVPGLAFDRHGNRLGQGKGYYDRFLARMCRDTTTATPILVAVALQCQWIESQRTIPVHEHDFQVNYVILPNEIIKIETSK